MFTILFLHPGLAEAGRESGEMLRQMKELSASARAANHIRKVRYSCYPNTRHEIQMFTLSSI